MAVVAGGRTPPSVRVCSTVESRSRGCAHTYIYWHWTYEEMTPIHRWRFRVSKVSAAATIKIAVDPVAGDVRLIMVLADSESARIAFKFVTT